MTAPQDWVHRLEAAIIAATTCEPGWLAECVAIADEIKKREEQNDLDW